MTTEQTKKEIRNKKDRERYRDNVESRAKRNHRTYKSMARKFLTEMIREEEKAEFKELLKRL